MFGYVRPSGARLSEADRECFAAAYCGLCRTLGERCGLASRFILNYDLAFLAILLWEGEMPEPLRRGCIAHPAGKRPYFPGSAALDLAADYSVILAWWQVRDALADPGGGKAKYRLVSGALEGGYRRAAARRPAFDGRVRAQLERLRALEEGGCASLDEPADAFAQLLAGAAQEAADPVKRRVLEQFLYHLGRWIYLVDAADDLTEDFASGSYNPLLRRFGLAEGKLTGEARESLVVSLDHSIRLMGAAVELWDFGAWSGVVRSVVYEGLFLVGGAVLEGTFHDGGGARGPCRGNKVQL